MDEDEELVPPSLRQHVVPILRTAMEIEEENPRVAFLCRFTAFEKAMKVDPNSSGRGVRQFKTYLLHRLEMDEQETMRKLAATDAKEIQRFFEQYCEKNLWVDIKTKSQEEMASCYEIASVLHDVLKTVTPEKYHAEFDMYAKGIERDKPFLFNYNILPLNIPGTTQPVMEIPEIKAAVKLLCSIDNLPKPRIDPTSADEEMGGPVVRDLFDWLWRTFGFQKSNVENQKEHLILLLANIDMRKGSSRHQSETQNHEIRGDTVTYLMRKIFQNYISWCQYLQLESNIKIPRGFSIQQPELLYVGLYLLIWGEASNVRFMPECLCYIFHHMARDLYAIISNRREDSFDPPFIQNGHDDAFLQLIIQPIFTVMQKEAAISKYGTTSHSKWRNYDDLNEYFWSKKCFKQLGWPMDPTSEFFVIPTKSKNDREISGYGLPMMLLHAGYLIALIAIRWATKEEHDHVVRRQRIPKTNFVELRTFLLLFRSFDRMWTFLILAFQAMVIIAWSPSRSLSAMFEPTIFRGVMTIFVTDAFLNFLQAMLEIVLKWKAWRSLEYSQMIRYVLKFASALAWLMILPTMYLSSWIGNMPTESIYNFAVALYIFPYILSALFFIFLPFRRALELSNSCIVRFFLWWTQPKLYVARGMYALFWILLLICKLAFSFYVEISPLVGYTRKIMFSEWGSYEHAMVYFMDIQIWYAIFSTICGGMSGAFSGVGEIRNLEMLRSRFEAIPRAFGKNLVPRHGSQSNRNGHEDGKNFHIEEFSDIWNAFIISLREEDLLSNRERNLLIVPSSMAMGETTVFQWPPFLLANKIPFALGIAKSVKANDEELRKRIKEDPYTYYAVIECYETMFNILYGLIDEPNDKKVVDQIRGGIEDSIRRQSLVKEFQLDELPQLSAMFDKLIGLLLEHYHADMKRQIITLLQDIMEIITQDIMKNGQGILKDENIFNQHFANINLDSVKSRSWRDKCVRLQLLLETKESATYVPMNLEAQRRIIFFANSLFMKMPKAPQVRSMMSFSVLTPYFEEEVLLSPDDLYTRNEHGVSIIFYLREIYPDEWKNFLERINFKPKDEDALKDRMSEICPWASYRAQTLFRTVRGMMYYRKALEIQCLQDKADLDQLDRKEIAESSREAIAIADIKFTYVVTCQVYGMQKVSKDARDKSSYLNILNLMIMYPSLRVAYIDEVEVMTADGMKEKTYYSVLVKGGIRYDEEIYRIKLPGKPTDIGEAKPENQNHAIIFTRGEALQPIDMNQDNYLEEASKMRNLLEEFEGKKNGKSKPTILGLREHIFNLGGSSLAWFMSNQEISFVTIGQRVLANLLKVRFHYGHSDIFDRIFHITRGGISKASKTINLSEGIFSGFNSILREGNVTHYEYMQAGKGHDIGMNQISSLESKVAIGNGEQTLSRDIYRLGQRFDFYRMLSVYCTTVGFYFSSMVAVLAVYVFLYGRLYLAMKGLETSSLLNQPTHRNVKPLETALASQCVFQLGLLLLLPMFMEIGLENGLSTALGEVVIMHLQLASMFFTFQLGTKIHYYSRTILHGGAKHRPALGRVFVVYHAKFAENYRMFSRSHFVKGLELLMLLVLNQVYGSSYRMSNLHLFLTYCIWFLVASWLFAPFIFNPSCFEWQTIVDDWTDWRVWMENREGIGMSVDQSWEAWWSSEQEHLRKSSVHIRLLEIILSLRFLIHHCSIVCYLNIAHPSEGILVYALSWLLVLLVLVVLKMDFIGQQIFGKDLQLMFRILKALGFLVSVFVVAVLFVIGNLTISDVIVGIIGFMAAGWCILLIGQASSPLLKKKTMLWDTIMELGRVYDNMMGFILFFPIAVLSRVPFMSELQARLLFNRAFSQGLQMSRILAGQKDIEEFE
ncbi:hypothetical protein ACP70R_012127 [Stipagrostis hirtigluma subsp. patula]